MMQERKIHTKNPLSGGPPKKLVFFLHGYGANGADLFDLSNPFSKVLPEAKFISPDAPHQCKMSPIGKEWFPIEEIPYGAKNATNDLLEFIEYECEKEKLTINDVVLIGFSQGAMMSIQAMLLSKNNFFAVLGYSGNISYQNVDFSRDFIRDGNHKNSKTPVLLIHGEEDEVVPFVSLENSKKLLSNVGFIVKTLIRPSLGHGIDHEGISAGMEFLKKLVNN